MNYYAVEVFQNIYVYIGHSFHHMAIIIIVLSVKIIAIPRRTDYVNVGTGEHSCNETGASSVLSIIITEQKRISDCYINFVGASIFLWCIYTPIYRYSWIDFDWVRRASIEYLMKICQKVLKYLSMVLLVLGKERAYIWQWISQPWNSLLKVDNYWDCEVALWFVFSLE